MQILQKDFDNSNGLWSVRFLQENIILSRDTGKDAYRISTGINGGALDGTKITFAIFLDIFFLIFGVAKTIAQLGIVASTLFYLVGVTEIVEDCSGVERNMLVAKYTAITLLSVGLLQIATGVAVIAYIIGLNTFSPMIFGAGVNHFCAKNNRTISVI